MERLLQELLNTRINDTKNIERLLKEIKEAEQKKLKKI